MLVWPAAALTVVRYCKHEDAKSAAGRDAGGLFLVIRASYGTEGAILFSLLACTNFVVLGESPITLTGTGVKGTATLGEDLSSLGSGSRLIAPVTGAAGDALGSFRIRHLSGRAKATVRGPLMGSVLIFMAGSALR